MNSSLPLLPSKVRKVEVKECFPETTESFLSVKEREQNLWRVLIALLDGIGYLILNYNYYRGQ